MSSTYPATTRIGILADSHGQAGRTLAAVSLLLEAGADVLIHLGDVCGESVLDALAGTPCRVVFGNCDWNWQALARYARDLDLIVDHPRGEIEVGGRRVRYGHGDDPQLEPQAVRDEVEYLLHGHSHQRRDERIGLTRVINPGALHRAREYTAAVLIPAEDAVEWVNIPAAALRLGGTAERGH